MVRHDRVPYREKEREGNSNQVVHYFIEEDQSSIRSSVLKIPQP